MDTFKKLTLGLIAIVVLLVLVGFLLPAQTHVERAVQIDMPVKMIFPLLNDFKQFNQWSPWAKKSDDIEYRFAGPAQGVGSIMHWRSANPQVGVGSQEIVASVPEQSLRVALRIEGMPDSQAAFHLEPNAEGARVLWSFDIDHGSNIISRYFGALAMDSMVGEDYEAGLANLKVLAEALPMPVKQNIVTQEIPYEVNGAIFKGYLAYDLNIETAPGVLVVHEWWGHNDYARNRAEQLAELGYAAFALDMYGDGKVADHPKQAGEFAGEVAKNMDAAIARFAAAMQVLKEHGNTDPAKIAAIGYCFGGGVVLNMAKANLGLDLVASFHGGLQSLISAKGEVNTRVLVFNGAADPFVKKEHIDAFKQEMDQAGIGYDFIDYPGVKHSFTNPGADQLAEKFDLPLAYNAEADQDSWQRLTTVLSEVFSIN